MGIDIGVCDHEFKMAITPLLDLGAQLGQELCKCQWRHYGVCPLEENKTIVLEEVDLYNTVRWIKISWEVYIMGQGDE
ncbi:MAG: hypothetical protein AB1815_10405 [Bacillota bacterium]|jgi:hypothetical protein